MKTYKMVYRSPEAHQAALAEIVAKSAKAAKRRAVKRQIRDGVSYLVDDLALPLCICITMVAVIIHHAILLNISL